MDKFKMEHMQVSTSGQLSDINNRIDFRQVPGTTSQFLGEEQIRLNDIELLRSEVSELKRELRNKKAITTEESLIQLWDNEYDERWNDL